jgi:cytochrome c oxidase assembly factor CtaG
MSALAPDPALLALLVPLAVVLLVAARRHRRWPLHRTLAGLLGLATLAMASCRALDAQAERLLSVHMAQHMVVQFVAAPLLVAAAPVRLALGALGASSRRRLARSLHSSMLRAFAHPLVGLSVFVITLAVVHLPAVYEAALRNPLAHAAEHAALLWSAIALWVPVIAADPLPRRAGAVARVGTLLAAMGAMGALGAVFMTLDRLAYPSYAVATLAAGRDPLRDQALAGGVMWVTGMLVVVPALVVLAWHALSTEERAQRVRDAAGTRAIAGSDG